MNRVEFILSLQDRLSALPRKELEERLAFYNEMIDDKIEDGLSEEEAVAQIGSIDEIVSQIIAETPLTTLVKEKMKPKKGLKAWEIVLLAVGSPIWFSLLVAAFAVVISLYAALWSVVISLWSAYISVAVCAPAGIIAGIVFICNGHSLSGVAMIAAGLVCAGLAVFLFYGCRAATKGSVWLTERIALAIKRCFIKKEDAQ